MIKSSLAAVGVPGERNLIGGFGIKELHLFIDFFRKLLEFVISFKSLYVNLHIFQKTELNNVFCFYCLVKTEGAV